MMHFRAFILFFGVPCAAFAQSQMVQYSSGTGFFVNRDGYVITNHHVVAQCNSISVHNDAASMAASVVAFDQANDLALLRTTFTATDAASLSTMRESLKAGDEVVVVGYPGSSWQKRQTVTRAGKIISDKGPTGEDKWLQFTDTVSQGNSGGPLLDGSGHVIGVVAAKAALYKYREAGLPPESVTESDIAISLPILRAFLDANSVIYRSEDSTTYLSADRVADRAAPFIVNVHCRVN